MCTKWNLFIVQCLLHIFHRESEYSTTNFTFKKKTRKLNRWFIIPWQHENSAHRLIGVYFRFDHSFVHSLHANPRMSFSLKIFPSELRFERSDSDDRLILQFLIREVQHGVF